MRNEVTVAVAKGIKSAAVSMASGALTVGTHNIDTLVRVVGTITKGEDYEQVQHMKVDQWGMIAVLLSKINGATIESVVREVNSVDPEYVTTIKKAAQEAMDKVKEPANVLTAGKVTTKLEISEVQ